MLGPVIAQHQAGSPQHSKAWAVSLRSSLAQRGGLSTLRLLSPIALCSWQEPPELSVPGLSPKRIKGGEAWGHC